MKRILSVVASLMLGKSLIKWKQCPDMTIAVDWDVKHQLKQQTHILCHKTSFETSIIVYCKTHCN